MKKIIIIIILAMFGLYSCDESTVTEPKSEFEEFTDKVWVYQRSNIGYIEDYPIQKMKFNQDSICNILINNNWESGIYELLSNINTKEIVGFALLYDNDSINNVGFLRYHPMSFKTFNKDSFVVHFGLTKENSWHTYVPEK